MMKWLYKKLLPTALKLFLSNQINLCHFPLPLRPCEFVSEGLQGIPTQLVSVLWVAKGAGIQMLFLVFVLLPALRFSRSALLLLFFNSETTGFF